MPSKKIPHSAFRISGGGHFALPLLLSAHLSLAASVSSNAGLSFSLDESTGNYSLHSTSPDWTFSGTLQTKLQNIRTSDETSDKGTTTHLLQADIPNSALSISIRLPDDQPTALFSWTTSQPADAPPINFPTFNSLPENLHALSYSSTHFADPAFKLLDTGTPYILFDDAANTAIISPASNFLTASMSGTLDDGGSIVSGFNKGLKNLPANFTHDTLLAIAPGIHNTYLTWGRALSAHLHAVRPTNDADTVLRYLGYWTDNGATYYYNYDADKGYTGTLEALLKSYRDEKLPFRYLQLDSWWYQKSLMDYKGKIGKTKNAKLPEGTWNRYGGTLEYKAHPFLFPNGLAAWQQSAAVNLPLVVHARWIDLNSPYRQQYKISGVVAVDPQFWNDITSYLHDSGVTCYEQDWLNFMYDYSPDMQNTVDAGNAFADNMARACAQHNLSIQYCMAPARFFLQGAKYPNLTTIRVNDDRFDRKKWQNFFYTSLLAEATGKWPWVDVYRSTERDNLLLSVLSAGAVGTGDEIGKEDRDNLMQAVRADGVIVKPDAPIVASDASLIADAAAKHQPLLASTYTDDQGLKTIYAFAYMRDGDANTISFTPQSLGATGPTYLYQPSLKTAKLLQPTDIFTDTLDPKSSTYYILIPVGGSGIAFAGDQQKFVSNGKQRIASINDDGDALLATVLASPTETAITLHGFADKFPAVSATHASTDPVAYDTVTKHFTVAIHPDDSAPLDNFSPDPVRRITIRIAAH